MIELHNGTYEGWFAIENADGELEVVFYGGVD
jgi:hypothetical protein